MALKDIETYAITNDKDYAKIINGVAITANGEDRQVVVKYNDEILGLGEISSGLLKIKNYLKE